MPEQQPEPILRQLMLAYGDLDDQIVMPPCRKCGSRAVTRAPAPIPPDGDIFTEEFTAAAHSTFVCAGCGTKRAVPLDR